MARVLKALGLMSGTSMDGIDAAILETDGETIAAFGPTHFSPYGNDLRDRLRAAMDAAPGLRLDGPLPAAVVGLERDMTAAHAKAVASLLRESGLRSGDVEVVGFHGQTLVHQPIKRVSLQIGSGPQLASATGISVVSDFRSVDLRADRAGLSPRAGA